MKKEIWTIGHSTRSIEDFINILNSFNIETLADVRSFPGSRRFPHFNKENLVQSLKVKGIDYMHIKELGGRRKAKPDSKNTAWLNESFRGYADFMETTEFIDGADKLTAQGNIKKTAIMCSEAVWWKCHRSMISDHLKLNGWLVIHILSRDKWEEHPYTKPAKIIQGDLFYQ